ncbi:hypothetical protein CDD81_2835 [Ophiocordyceps australis]|uniref:Carboxymuconolactone decarboxylase-like domain-containing protein n=1 Tax=Ophiocordyceps australis TaxID=1399860 RepID=A0A2C5XT06_9HYPO|nr:hypothetical protein CDD81_2835 [Ophiocordyceps australis]
MRLPYVSDPPAVSSAEDAAIVQRTKDRRAPRPLQPLDLTLLHSTAITDGWNSFIGACRQRTSLSPDWAALVYADEMTRNVKVNDETFALVKGVFNNQEVVEITAIAAAYNCVSRFLVALNVGERNGTGPGKKSAA